MQAKQGCDHGPLQYRNARRKSNGMTETATHPFRIRLKADRPARYRKAIVFCCDDNYLPFATHAAAEIIAWAKSRDFDICLCFGERAVSVPESLASLDIRLCHVDVRGSFEGLRLDAGRTHDVYLRIALPAAFSNDYDRLLYLDSDIFVQGGDFSALMEVDITPHCVAAVRDHVQWRTPSRQNARNSMKGVPASAYFNAGVMLMDVKSYNDQDLMQRCINFGRARREELTRHDQNLYNAVLQGDWAELSPMWNWQFSWSARLFATLVSPHVLHFIGPAKPWKDRDAQFEPRFHNSYARFIASHFPDHRLEALKLPRMAPDSTKMAKMLIKHLLTRRKIARYLARFPDDLTVHR
jgi:lipopolysaccharide biosynthesis glycosyltransferase